MHIDWATWLIPVVAAVVGWGTNVVAVEMMFYPLSFVGIKPWFGWQGIIPANAKELAGRSTDVITTKLLNLRMLFADFDAAGFAGSNLDRVIDQITDEVIQQSAAKYAGPMWSGMNETIRGQIRDLLRAEIKQVTVQILAEVGDNIEDIIDLKAIVVDTAHRDRALIGQMFQVVGAQEFKFIKDSGLYFGFLFGIFQMLAWIIYPEEWSLPICGFLVGYVTNWLALKLIFQPAQPTRVGPFTIQGLFHKRQKEVATEFSNMVSRDILNPENMVRKMIEGEQGQKFFAIVDKHIAALLDKYQKNPMTAALVPADKWPAIREEVTRRVREDMPKPDNFLYIFTGRAINVYSELVERMTKLDSKSFEGILRPPFQKDEWKLIVIGGVLGFAAGVGQLVFMFGGSLF